MMHKAEIEIRTVEASELHENALDDFNRHQVTNRVLYRSGEQYLYKEDHFIDSWDGKKKKQIAHHLYSCAASGGIVGGAFSGGRMIGFACVENIGFGKCNEYLELSFLHVSGEFRNRGIGRQLFELCCEGARSKGAKKLYIASHPAEETQQFYGSIGCVIATEMNKDIYDKQPLDIQLEFELELYRVR